MSALLSSIKGLRTSGPGIPVAVLVALLATTNTRSVATRVLARTAANRDGAPPVPRRYLPQLEAHHV